MSVPLEDYALLGDCRSAALVSKHGSIDWLCWPRFDSDACFAALLGGPEHGRWSIAPCAQIVRVTRAYRDQTLVLDTRIETQDGEIKLTECMAMPHHETDAPQIVRVIEGRRGRVPMRMEWIVRFNYGSIVPWVTREDGMLRAIAGPHAVRLYADIPTHGEGMKTVAEFVVEEGQCLSFRMTYTPSHLPAEPPRAADQSLHRTESVWSEWSHRSHYSGAYYADVQRSLLTLKALTFAPTGGIVAAPTTSLPEQIGGTRNWDYRFCWIRDATITLYALLVTGHNEEAVAWRAWLLRAVAGSPSQAQILYGLAPGLRGLEAGARGQRGPHPGAARHLR
jgi:GH15 family glucan-1,4-alpha-glucosidase